MEKHASRRNTVLLVPCLGCTANAVLLAESVHTYIVTWFKGSSALTAQASPPLSLPANVSDDSSDNTPTLTTYKQQRGKP